MDNVLPNDLTIQNYVRPGDGSNLRVSENVLAHYNPKQRWYYLSGHNTCELLVFRQIDSAGNSGTCFPTDLRKVAERVILGVPHASFHYKGASDVSPRRRESIEVRALVYHE